MCMCTCVCKHAHTCAAVCTSGSMYIHCMQGEYARVCSQLLPLEGALGCCWEPGGVSRGLGGCWKQEAMWWGPQRASVSQPGPRAPGEAQAPPRGVWFRKHTFLTWSLSPFSSPKHLQEWGSGGRTCVHPPEGGCPLAPLHMDALSLLVPLSRRGWARRGLCGKPWLRPCFPAPVLSSRFRGPGV